MSFYPSGILNEIGLISDCTLFTGVPGGTKFPISPAFVIASLFVIFMIDV